MSDTAQSSLMPVWQLLQKSLAEKRLITIHFVTVFEYLAYLEAVAAMVKVWCLCLLVNLPTVHQPNEYIS